MRIAIGSDHAGYEYKLSLIDYIRELGHTVIDYGCLSSESVDYADYALPVAKAVSDGDSDRGVLVCYSGVGMCISANKVRGIRCSLCSEPVSARLTRAHNDANVLAMGAGIIGLAMAKEIVSVWLETDFDGGRHQKRIEKIVRIESMYADMSKGDYVTTENDVMIKAR